MGKDIQDYLDKGISGAPQLRPDEKRKFLGTYRERVVFVLTYGELTENKYTDFCMDAFQTYSNGTILINANVTMNIQANIMKLAQENHVTFRLVDTNDKTPQSDHIALVYALDHAINKEDIYLTSPKKQPQTPSVPSKDTNVSTDKEGFLKRLFKFK